MNTKTKFDIGQKVRIKLTGEVGIIKALYIDNNGTAYYVEHEEKWSTRLFSESALESYKPILDKVEKKYLSSFIRPFKDRVEYIEKSAWASNKEFIFIRTNKESFDISLPTFKAGTMYRGMELEKKYTIKELYL